MFKIQNILNKSTLISRLLISKSLTTTITTASDLNVNLSDSCIKKLKEISKGSHQNKHLRVSVQSGGCSGFEYKFLLDQQLNQDDLFIEKSGYKIIIDKETLDYLKGATIDYYEELIRSGFRIVNNPNAEHGCSCGSSFSIKI